MYSRKISCLVRLTSKSGIRKVVSLMQILGLIFTVFSTVIYQCGLTRDLRMFDAGDATEVGEKGLTLR